MPQGQCNRSVLCNRVCIDTPDCKYGLGGATFDKVRQAVDQPGFNPGPLAYPRGTLAGERRIEKGPDTSVAVKQDDGKIRAELLPVGPMLAIAEVLTFGAKKYADHNWRKGFKWSRLLGAAMRHLFSFMRGEDKDPETGLSHLAHLGCCVMFLLEHEQNKLGEDDRHVS